MFSKCVIEKRANVFISNTKSMYAHYFILIFYQKNLPKFKPSFKQAHSVLNIFCLLNLQQICETFTSNADKNVAFL